ncbi:MAG: hypothetical protein IT581_19910 [Verrucomicrobiales bacterium]|nr:hypothetical protein [Verrucomicrobiales bacterium]
MAPSAPHSSPEPTTTSSWRVFAIPAILALVGYILLYGCDRRLRVHRGPWQVTFDQASDGTPLVRIDQPELGISNVVVRFEGETLPPPRPSLPVQVRFDNPDRPVPFGTLAFHDLMYQPGTVVLQCFGHEVQMLPKALYLNRATQSWRNDESHLLSATNKPASLAPPKAVRSAFGGLRPGPQLTNDSRY